MLFLPFILFIKSAYAGTGSAQDSGLLFVSAILFFTSILLFIYIYEQTKKLINRFLHSSDPDMELDNDNPVQEITDAL